MVLHRNKNGTHFTRGWVVLGADLEDTQNLTLQEFYRLTLQLAAGLYTDCNLPAAVKREPYISLNYSRCVTKMDDVITVMERDFIWVADVYQSG